MRMLLQQSKEIFQLVAEGHDIVVTKHGKPIARITPEQVKAKPFQRPDFLARIREDFPEGNKTDQDPINILLKERYGDEHEKDLL